MLRINRQTDYAVRMLLALAQRGEQTRLSTTAIQQEMLIPLAHGNGRERRVDEAHDPRDFYVETARVARLADHP